MSDLYYVRYDEDWIRQGGAMTATSERVGYEATKVVTDDPSEPWWANSGTATLTATFAGAREIGLIGLIMTNADDAEVITVGGLTGVTLVGKREQSGYPRDLAFIVDPPQSVSSFTLSITGNSNHWSIGSLVAGIRRSISGFQDPMEIFPTRPAIVDPGIPEHGHDIRYDVGVDQLKIADSPILTYADYFALQELNSAQRYGFNPALFYFDSRFPPIFARLLMERATTKEGHYIVPITLQGVSRGLEVVGA